MPDIRGPDEIYGPLFEAVQGNRVFGDSKTFVDAVPRHDVATVLERFAALDEPAAVDTLRSFVESNFVLPDGPATVGVAVEPDVRARIEQLWPVLSRAADRVQSGSSLIELPRPYVVPGGRFREIYYWDSYFTMLGLAESGRVDAVEDMVQNFAYLIDRVGFIPNGNRSYFCTRSQPPFFVLMVELLAAARNDLGVVVRYLPQLEREYGFWMQGSEHLRQSGDAVARVVRVGDALMNRHWDAVDRPRAESYAEDRTLASTAGRDPAELFRDLRAACESGWDFTSRWLDGSGGLETIRTTKILPVDLNCLLYRLESVLASVHGAAGATESARHYGARAAARQELLQTEFFDDREGWFVDLLHIERVPTGQLSLAAAYPLFLNVATPEQAARVSARLGREFLAPGGWRASLAASGQQWDRPNGWAPLHWVTYRGLINYGFGEQAGRGARRWVDNCLSVYRGTGRLLEKYNVEDVGALAAGGEYAVQDGFGWTNAVLLMLMNRLGRRFSS